MTRRFFTYTRLQLKRMLHYAPCVFLVTLIIGICLAVALTAIVKMDNSEEDQQKMVLGVVGNFEESYLGIGLSALKSFDSSRFFLDVLEYNAEDAEQALQSGDIHGYVIIPDGFIDDALSGEVGKLTFVTMNTNAQISNMFKQEVLELVSRIMVESQNGVYGLQSVLLENGYKYKDAVNEMNELSLEYVALIVSRSAALDVEIIGVSENLTFGGYMFSAICILLTLLSGIVCCPLFIRRDHALPKLMCANRYGVGIQIGGEYLAFTAVMALNTIVLLTIMLIGSGNVPTLIPEVSEMGATEIIGILLRFIPAISLITSLQYLLFQLSDSVVSGVLIQFISAVILGYASGCFYPISFFPKAMQAVSSALPSGIARGYLASLITDTASIAQMLAILGYTTLLLILSAVVRYRRIIEA